MTSHVTELKDKINTKTLNLVLLTIVTGGIYPILWIYRHCANIEQITKSKISGETFLIWLAVLFGLSGTLKEMGEGGAVSIRAPIGGNGPRSLYCLGFQSPSSP